MPLNDAPHTGIPAGVYRLNAHAHAKDIRLGKYPGTVGYIGVDGKEVIRVPATIETFSLEVPQPLPFERTQFTTHITTNPNPAERKIIFHKEIFCPNGSIIIITFH